MYAKCGYVQEACNAFEMLHNRNVVSWNAMLTGYIQNGENLLALECLEKMQEDGIMPNAVSWGAIVGGFAQHGHGLMAVEHFRKMQLKGVKPDGVTFLNVLKACAAIGDQQQGRLIHGQITENNMSLDPALGTTLVDMYAKCGSLVEACKAFDKLPVRNVVSWDAMIEGYVQNEQGSLALQTFEKMQKEGVKPDDVTFLGALKACSCLGEIELGRLIHNQISESGYQSDAVGNTLVDMYAKCGSLEEASKVFGALPKRDLVTWNAMISGYAQQGEGLLALDCLNEMEAAGIKPNAISWGARISGYTQHGKGVLALECFEKMQEDGTKPDEFTFSSILKACSSIGAIEKGRLVHQMILKSGVELDIVLGCTLIDMYAKCGNLNEAYNIFLELPNHNIVSWNAMISGHSQHGECLLAFRFLGKMQEKFIRPNEATFTSILIACSRAGLVDEGCWHYKYMGEFHVIPTGLHSACMTDLLGRAGYFSDVHHSLWDAIKNDISALTSLLNACKTYGNTDLGKRCFDQIALLDSSYCTGGYVLMSNIYADDALQKVYSSVIDVQLFGDMNGE